MNNEQLKRGIFLKNKIEVLKMDISIIRKSSKYRNSTINIIEESMDSHYIDIDRFISFSELQNLAIQRMQAKLYELEEEFNKL